MLSVELGAGALDLSCGIYFDSGLEAPEVELEEVALETVEEVVEEGVAADDEDVAEELATVFGLDDGHGLVDHLGEAVEVLGFLWLSGYVWGEHEFGDGVHVPADLYFLAVGQLDQLVVDERVEAEAGDVLVEDLAGLLLDLAHVVEQAVVAQRLLAIREAGLNLAV